VLPGGDDGSKIIGQIKAVGNTIDKMSSDMDSITDFSKVAAGSDAME